MKLDGLGSYTNDKGCRRGVNGYIVDYFRLYGQHLWQCPVLNTNHNFCFCVIIVTNIIIEHT